MLSKPGFVLDVICNTARIARGPRSLGLADGAGDAAAWTGRAASWINDGVAGRRAHGNHTGANVD
jgi:hypothetical protein